MLTAIRKCVRVYKCIDKYHKYFNWTVNKTVFYSPDLFYTSKNLSSITLWFDTVTGLRLNWCFFQISSPSSGGTSLKIMWIFNTRKFPPNLIIVTVNNDILNYLSMFSYLSNWQDSWNIANFYHCPNPKPTPRLYPPRILRRLIRLLKR